MQDSFYLVAFSIGVLSSLHCLGMCGGIIGALSIGLSGENRSQPVRVFAYNLGRISSYAMAGVIVGSMGYIFQIHDSGFRVLQILAAIILVLIGLQLGGWWSKFTFIEKIGLRLWHIIQPVGRYFLPVDNVVKAYLIGTIWGWLPCGMVYSVLLLSATTSDPVRGGLMMLAFGVGTLPAMVGAGYAGVVSRLKLVSTQLRKAFAIAIIIFGCVSPWIYYHHMDTGETGQSHSQH